MGGPTSIHRLSPLLLLLLPGLREEEGDGAEEDVWRRGQWRATLEHLQSCSPLPVSLPYVLFCFILLFHVQAWEQEEQRLAHHQLRWSQVMGSTRWDEMQGERKSGQLSFGGFTLKHLLPTARPSVISLQRLDTPEHLWAVSTSSSAQSQC